MSYCVGGRHMSKNVNPQVYEKINPRSEKRVKITKSICNICNRKESQIFTM